MIAGWPAEGRCPRAILLGGGCVSRDGGQSSGACCGCGASRMSGVIRRRASMPVCVHASLPPSLLGRPSVIGYREARPCQARVVRTLYSCEARRWVHGTQRGEGSCARCVRTMRIMLCYVMLCPRARLGSSECCCWRWLAPLAVPGRGGVFRAGFRAIRGSLGVIGALWGSLGVIRGTYGGFGGTLGRKALGL